MVLCSIVNLQTRCVLTYKQGDILVEYEEAAKQDALFAQEKTGVPHAVIPRVLLHADRLGREIAPWHL